MKNLIFCDRLGRELPFDSTAECYVIPQYEKWVVKPLDSSLIPHFKSGDKFYPLDRNDYGYAVPRYKSALWAATEKSVSGGAFKLTLFKSDGTLLLPGLYVYPQAITEEEFAIILDRLGQLAIINESGFLAPVSILRPEDENLTGQSRVRGDAYENLLDSVLENWEIIKQHPAKEIKISSQIVDLTNPRNVQSIRTIQQAAQKPHQRRQEISERSETYDSNENRFLVHVLRDVLLPKAKPLAKYLRGQATNMRKIQRQPDGQHGRRYITLWQQRRVEIEAEATRLENRAEKIEEKIAKIKGYLNTPFLQEACTTADPMQRPSAKIAGSKEYGPIYKAYQDFLNNRQPVKQKSLVWALEEKAIRKTSSLYEIWVFLEIYACLVHNFGFEPVGSSPLDLAEVIDGEVTLQPGSEYQLQFYPRNFPKRTNICTLVLSYTPSIKPPACAPGKRCFHSAICKSLPCYSEIHLEKNWYKLTPDATMLIQTEKHKKKIALDMKYRNYANQRNNYLDKRQKYQVDSVFGLDLLFTSKMKYLNGLDLDAAFFLHSDPDSQYTTFGEEPLYKNPHREEKLGIKYWPAHQVGAIGLTPHHPDALDKLLRCILMYHAELESVCWNQGCHISLAQGNGMEKQPGRKGDYYQCTTCGDFWIRQRCRNQHHMLIKMGRGSFHKISPRNDWSCTCPACGDSYDNDPATTNS